MTKRIMVAIAVIIVAALVAVSAYFAFNDTTYEVTVVKMERLSYSDNNAKYLIYCETDGGQMIVFENAAEPLRGKWSRQEFNGIIREGERYEFIVVGIRIAWLNSYQNIIEVKQLNTQD